MKTPLFIVLMVLCFSAQAQVTRCVNATTGMVTYTNRGCPASEKPTPVAIHQTSGATMGSARSAARPQSSNNANTPAKPRGRCVSRCPYNGKCLRYE